MSDENMVPKTPSHVEQLSTDLLLTILRRRGGLPGILAEAAQLAASKARDYNSRETDPYTADKAEYFPFGLTSVSQMVHTKSMRLVSLARKDGNAVHESATDTLLDVINYAGFGVCLLRKGGDQ